MLVGAARRRMDAKRCNDKLRAQMLEAYGLRCVCCRLSIGGLLTLDHVIETGARLKNERGLSLYAKLRKLGWPQDNLRLLCWNCNCGRQSNGGQCPHFGLKELNAEQLTYRYLREQAFDVYGDGCCACCGERNIGFLTIDHVENVGGGRRRVGGIQLYRSFRQRGWPMRDELRVLCWNCNCGRQHNGGVCPHEIVGCQ